MKLWKTFFNGIIVENPALRLVLGMCPLLAVTTSIQAGIGMGAAVIFVLLGSNLFISLIKKIVPGEVRIPIYIVVIATFVTMVQLFVKAFAPVLDKQLGIFIPLIVVNCVILARAEAFASKNKAVPSILDGLGMGLGFTLALVIVSSIREILGAGTFFGISLFGEAYKPLLIMILPPGGFMVLGFTIAAVNKLTEKKKS